MALLFIWSHMNHCGRLVFPCSRADTPKHVCVSLQNWGTMSM